MIRKQEGLKFLWIFVKTIDCQVDRQTCDITITSNGWILISDTLWSKCVFVSIYQSLWNMLVIRTRTNWIEFPIKGNISCLKVKVRFRIMINRRVSSLEASSNGGGGSLFSTSPSSGVCTPHFAYSRSISTPSPSLPKAIPLTRTYRSRSMFAQNGNGDGNFPPASAPVTFNRYINVSCNPTTTTIAGITAEQGSSPSSWYSRLSNSLKKSVLRRSTSYKERQQRQRAGQHRRSVIISFVLISNGPLVNYRWSDWVCDGGGVAQRPKSE